MPNNLDRPVKPDPPRWEGRWAFLIGFIAIGSVLAIVYTAVKYPEIGTIAYAAIASIGGIAGGTLAVLGVIVQTLLWGQERERGREGQLNQVEDRDQGRA